jgi:hypothetical protein
VRFDEGPLCALPEWLRAHGQQGRVDGFAEAAQARQACTESLQGVQHTLSNALALQQCPVVIPAGQEVQGIWYGRRDDQIVPERDSLNQSRDPLIDDVNIHDDISVQHQRPLVRT